MTYIIYGPFMDQGRGPNRGPGRRNRWNGFVERNRSGGVSVRFQ